MTGQSKGGGATPRLSPSLARLREETRAAEEALRQEPNEKGVITTTLAAKREATKALEESLKNRSLLQPPPQV